MKPRSFEQLSEWIPAEWIPGGPPDSGAVPPAGAGTRSLRQRRSDMTLFGFARSLGAKLGQRIEPDQRQV